MSQSEEEEFRKMAEIADAINDILENNKLDDTPNEDDPANAAPDESVTSDIINEQSADTPISEQLAPFTGADNNHGADLDESLEAALAAEIASDLAGDLAGDLTGDLAGNAPLTETETETDTSFISGTAFDAPPNLDNMAALDDPNSEVMTDPLSAPEIPDLKTEEETDAPFDKFLDNDMAFLSLRMRDTLAELKSEHGDTLEATESLIGKMALSVDGLVEEMHSSLGTLEKKITSRKASINQEIDRIYQEIATTRSELELLVSKFQNDTAENHRTYNDIFSEERGRVERYREFLSFMIRDKK